MTPRAPAGEPASIAISNASTRRFSDWPPLAKLAAWGGLVLAIPATVAGATWLGTGVASNLFETSSGRSVIMAFALFALAYVMAWDRRPLSDYGLALQGRWGRQVGLGVALGLTFYLAYYGLCLTMGVYHLHAHQITAKRVLVAVLAALSSMPLAVAQQLIFSGYLPSVLRDRHSRAVSVIIPALIFGVFGGISAGALWDSPSARGLTVGMFLVAVLLSLVRFSYGSITLPVGLLAGAIMARRLVKKLNCLAYDPTNAWTDWLAPEMDPRQGGVMWAFLGVGVLGAVVVLARRGEPTRVANEPSFDKSFKQIVPFSNLMALAPLDLWLRKLSEARWQVGLKYVPRLIFTLAVSTLNTILSLPERLLAPRLLRHEIPDPVFIVGVHRSGTTHLHNLLALDRQFVAPKTYQIFNPHGFLSGLLTTVVLGPFMTSKRPMDSVQMTMFSPQEEEFAIAALTPSAPYWFGCFPRLFASHERFIYPQRMSDAELSDWRSKFVFFLRKLTFWQRRRPLLKSPYNTARVALLKELFPRARFVHIARHPYAVYRSNMHLAEHGWAIFQLQDAETTGSYAERFLSNYREQEELYERDAAQLSPDELAEITYEELERDPVQAVEQIYAALGLEYTLDYAQRLRAYVASVADYRKNKFAPLPADEQAAVDEQMANFMQRWGYASANGQPSRAAA